MYYQNTEILSTAIGNNAFSYEARKTLGSQCTLTIPALMQGNFDDIKIGHDIVFEEIDDKGHLQSCNGLASLLLVHSKSDAIGHTTMSPHIYIMDNHNHALYFRYREHITNSLTAGTTLIHIDQHADMGVPSTIIDTTQCNNLNYIAQYTNEICNVGNFIQPAINSGLISDVRQVRSVSKLFDLQREVGKIKKYILDIDIDFWVSHNPSQEEINIIRALYQHSTLCTISLSPYFIPLDRSIAIMKQLFQQ